MHSPVQLSEQVNVAGVALQLASQLVWQLPVQLTDAVALHCPSHWAVKLPGVHIASQLAGDTTNWQLAVDDRKHASGPACAAGVKSDTDEPRRAARRRAGVRCMGGSFLGESKPRRRREGSAVTSELARQVKGRRKYRAVESGVPQAHGARAARVVASGMPESETRTSRNITMLLAFGALAVASGDLACGSSSNGGGGSRSGDGGSSSGSSSGSLTASRSGSRSGSTGSQLRLFVFVGIELSLQRGVGRRRLFRERDVPVSAPERGLPRRGCGRQRIRDVQRRTDLRHDRRMRPERAGGRLRGCPGGAAMRAVCDGGGDALEHGVSSELEPEHHLHRRDPCDGLHRRLQLGGCSSPIPPHGYSGQGFS